MGHDSPGRLAVAVLTAVGLLAAATACSGTGDEVPVTRGGDVPATALSDRVTAHLLAAGARIARAHHPDRHWFRGSLVVPAGGATCAVASIATGAHGPLVTDAVFDPSGMVSVRVRAAARDRERCLASVRRALATFDASP